MTANHRRVWQRAFPLVLSLALAAGLLVVLPSALAGPGLGRLFRLTSASDADRDSMDPSVSRDGTLVAFESDSDPLNQGIASNQYEIWLYDTQAMTYTRVTSASHTNRESWNPSLNGDGTVVAFQSDSDFLNQGIANEQWEVWLYDTGAMTYTRATSGSHAFRTSWDPSLNGDGTVVAFRSDSDFLNQGIASNQYEIWLYDTQAMTYTRVTSASHPNRDSFNPSLSGDGTAVAFRSDSDFLNGGIADNRYEVWLCDTATMTYTRITTASHPNRNSQGPNLSGDGTVVAFHSDSDLLNEGRPAGVDEIWLYDTAAMTYTRVTSASHPNRDSRYPSLSMDGSAVAFYSDSDFLNEGRPAYVPEIWLYDTATMTYTRVTSASDPSRGSYETSLSGDGTAVAFYSDSDLLNEGRANDVNEIWLWKVFDEDMYLPLVLRKYP